MNNRLWGKCTNDGEVTKQQYRFNRFTYDYKKSLKEIN